MEVTREFTVAVFVVHADRVLLHHHPKLGRWLPPGGHIEPGELPDEAALREVHEETGVRARLIGERALPLAYPRQLARPAGIQLEDIAPGHQHIDLVYFAVAEPDGVAISEAARQATRAGWYALEELPALGVDAEIRAWAARALEAVRAWRAQPSESA
jgi:ADP-ribose pyrophosphatase YjhB (NUDIX family)